MERKTTYTVSGLWLVVALVVWMAAVPAAISTSTFVWMNALVFGGIFALGAIMRGGQTSRSIGGILYDTENPDLRK